MKKRVFLALIMAVFLMVCASAQAGKTKPQIELPPFESVEYVLDSGMHDGVDEEFTKVFQQEIYLPDAVWLRLHFDDYNFGRKSYLTITSSKDGSRQRLNAVSMDQWKRSSAFFNGNTVVIELYAAPGESGIFFQLVRVTKGLPDEQPVSKSLCDGDDDRVVSTDSRVGRILAGGCTAFLISNGAVLTAGHCVDFDPDEGGPGLPDGVLDLSGVMEFNVPLSSAGGLVQMADADDQYPVDTTSVEWGYEGSGEGYGKDWAIFAIGPNANNGDRAHVTRGFFRVTREIPAVGSTIRVTGFGADDDPAGSTGSRNQWNKTCQTDTGTYEGETISGANIWHEHRADTRGASSGSPIIWNVQNIVIGIHTNAGCSATGGANAGTSFEHNPLEAAVNDFPTSLAVYADSGMPALATESGSAFRPYNTVTEAVSSVVNGGTVSIVEGSYSRSSGNTFIAGEDGKAMLLTAPVGTVIIGD